MVRNGGVGVNGSIVETLAWVQTRVRVAIEECPETGAENCPAVWLLHYVFRQELIVRKTLQQAVHHALIMTVHVPDTYALTPSNKLCTTVVIRLCN